VSELLDRLIREAEAELKVRRAWTSPEDMEQRIEAAPAPFDFVAALRAREFSVIAEMKARTPLGGRLTYDYAPAKLAADYRAGGAAAISVLCQETSFGGKPEHLLEAKQAARLPVMRKDFITDEFQIREARAFGADAVLLIARILDFGRLNDLVACTHELGMEAVVEVHDEHEVETALNARALVIGVNHRDLATFEIDPTLTERLRAVVPHDCVLVAESGITGRADASSRQAAGANAILVGEALMRAHDRVAKLRELTLA
jgi:indole-3-glycerol phosphate synthase